MPNRVLFGGVPLSDVPRAHLRGTKLVKGLPVGGKLVIIKIQIPLSSPLNEMLVYTETRDLMCYIRRADTPEAYDEIMKIVQAKGVQGIKGYFSGHLKSHDHLVITTSEVLNAQSW